MVTICPTCMNAGLTESTCPVCLRTSLSIHKNKYTYKNKTYTYKEWCFHTSNFKHFGKNKIELKNEFSEIGIGYLRQMFLENIRKHSFFGLILPSVVFLALSLVCVSVSILIDNKRIFGEALFPQDYEVLLYFLSVVFLVLSLGLLYLAGIKKTKCLYTRVRGHAGYKRLSSSEYKEMLESFNTCEENHSIFFPKLNTPRLCIRESRWSDAKDYYGFLQKEIVHTHLGTEAMKSYEESVSSIRRTIGEYYKGQIFRLAVELIDEKKVIGYIGLSKYDLSVTSCQIIYAYNDAYWGKGYASEAVEAFVRYLKSVGKTLIIAGHVKDNSASGNVLLKNGFKRDPARDTKMMIHGQIKEIVNYSIDERVADEKNS